VVLAKVLPFVRREQRIADGDQARDEVARKLVDDYLTEVKDHVAGFPWASQLRPVNFATGRVILKTDPALQTAVLLAAIARLVRLVESRNHGTDAYALRGLLTPLCRRPQAYTADDVRALVALLAASDATWSSWIPLQPIVRTLDRWVADRGLTAEIRTDLERLRAAGRHAAYADERKAVAQVEAMLGGAKAPHVVVDANDDWGRAVEATLAATPPVDGDPWVGLLTHAAGASGSKPTKPWLGRSKAAIARAGEARCREQIVAWLDLLRAPAPAPSPVAVPTRETVRRDINGHPVPTTVLTERNGDLLKGLAWSCALFDDPAVARALGDAAEACFKKIPNVGARSTKVGNACLYALGAMPGMDGVAQLQRLRQRVKQPSARAQIDAAHENAARREGMTRDDLDDLAVPTFDLADGRLRRSFGAARAELVVAGVHDIRLNWFGTDGKPRASEPADVKRDQADDLKAIKRTADDLRKLLPAQRDRIERHLTTERSWRFAAWRTRYLDHPLLSLLARRLVWSFGEDGAVLGAWLDGEIVGVDDRSLPDLTDETPVRLWHPIAAEAATVHAWQDWLERHSVTQPFKQAHRELYALTDAERATENYSNRFASHILRQHQLLALCQARGWTYRLQGAFDNANVPTLDLPASDLAAEFWVEPIVEGEESLSPAGISLYAGTDQVRFRRRARREPVPLTEVPPRVFSEVMRDVDLFVGVCSVGLDPTWRDRGPAGHQTYWHDFAFGDLSASAQTRRAVLERLVPRLAIADRCTVADKFLVVRGNLRTYKIHLGSGNILMNPNNQYLCIVPARGPAAKVPTQGLFLPFEGDGLLSVILSKAFLLAADTTITDPTITRQIGR
jgi:Domain of unknown function (DUF4132)